MHSPQGPQQLTDAISGLQLSENVVQSEYNTETPSSVEDICNLQQRSEPAFPHAKLAMLDEKISSPRWVVPVLPEQELECLLQASIELCRKGENILIICHCQTHTLSPWLVICVPGFKDFTICLTLGLRCDMLIY